MAANVGEGIATKMAEAGDTAITHEWDDSVYDDQGNVLTHQAKAWGTKGLYVASDDSGQWVTAGPFALAE